MIDKQKYDLYEIEIPSTDPFLLMEVIGMPIGKNLKVIKLKEDFPISVGRSDDCDVRINDSSVSNRHSILRFDTKLQKFILQDDHSKFGTLLLI